MHEPATCQLTLADGRRLSYTDTGSGDNGTWIHCHGIPGSRYELFHLNEDLCAAGLRLIVPDRPGYGDSTPCPQYGFAQHTADLRQLADHLGLERFSVSGFSGGGVFALATAHGLDNRVEQLTLAATPAIPLMDEPFEHASELSANAWRAALENPDALAVDLEALTGSADVLAEALLDAAGASERHQLASALVYPFFLKSLRAALEQGSVTAAGALARDSFLIAGSWPFRPGDINLPTRVIHGINDELVHKEHQVALASRLANSHSQLVDGHHYSVLASIWD